MKNYDCGIIGGGLAGLALAIQLAREGCTVALFEKEQYPFHRVCGEYISMESWAFLCSLGLPLADMELPRITRLRVSALNSAVLQHELKPGGFGISRFTLDKLLADIAIKNGVALLQTRVNDVQFSENIFSIETQQGNYKTNVAFGTFGKRSNLDVRIGRAFVKKQLVPVNNYIGIKYHVQLPFPADLIELHNFKNGYCGISKVDDNRYCLCYLTTAHNLRSNDNDIKTMEERVLMKNPYLERILKEAMFLYKQPLAISQVSFAPKLPVEGHLLMAGDAAGLITPLCGNGMSMALHAGKIAAALAIPYLGGKIDRDELEECYKWQWNKTFSRRLLVGCTLQRFFGQPAMTNLIINGLKHAPRLVNKLVGLTHGETF